MRKKSCLYDYCIVIKISFSFVSQHLDLVTDLAGGLVLVSVIGDLYNMST